MNNIASLVNEMREKKTNTHTNIIKCITVVAVNVPRKMALLAIERQE